MVQFGDWTDWKGPAVPQNAETWAEWLWTPLERYWQVVLWKDCTQETLVPRLPPSLRMSPGSRPSVGF